MKRLLGLTGSVALVAIGLAAGIVTSDVAAGDKIEGPNGEHQVVVCKYVGTPGEDERLQTGNNPIVVDSQALEGSGFTGVFPFDFSDQQGNSKAIRWASGPHDGSIAECPGAPPRTEVTATAPAFQDPTCEVGASVSLPIVTGVIYKTTGTAAPGHKVTVEATADEGYAFPEGATTKWEHTFGNVPDDCAPPPPPVIEVTPGVTFQDPTCDVGAAVTPTTATGITYVIDGTVAPGEKVTVTASADDGYTIVGNATWEHTFGHVPSSCATAPPTETTPTTPATEPTAPLTPPTTTTQPAKPAAKPTPAAKPAAKTAPPKKAVAGAYVEKKPTLAYTP